jgi:hypothetical protein
MVVVVVVVVVVVAVVAVEAVVAAVSTDAGLVDDPPLDTCGSVDILYLTSISLPT